jgi:prepilin-type N-terminal cleavage/methylation domain-containing protein/prepilin-type processing-associated H-X9-DG protein
VEHHLLSGIVARNRQSVSSIRIEELGRMKRRGFTLVELLVVIAIIGVLVALLLPAVQAAREAARRMQCGNNVKQLSLGLQNYHDTFLSLPYGARARSHTGTTNWGSSWLVATLPFCEQRPLYDKLVAVDIAAQANDYFSSTMQAQAHNAKIKYMLCPSSPLPETETINSQVLTLPSYTGIAGGTSDAGGGVATNVVTETRVATTSGVPSSPTLTGFGGNGMLPLNESLTFAACTDGTANTIIVGECADWYYSGTSPSSVTRQNPAVSQGVGWLAGASITSQATGSGVTISTGSVAGLQTVAHAVGTNNRNPTTGIPNWGGEGVGTRGPNNPLLSAHPAGAQVGFLDGHVQLLTKQTALFVLKRLAIRDDGGVIPDF